MANGHILCLQRDTHSGCYYHRQNSSYLLLDCDSITQVNGKLSYVDKHVSVRKTHVNADDLNQ